VKKGETLATIARRLKVSRADLAEANYLRTTSRVSTGQKLLIPRMPSAAVLARGGTNPASDAVVAAATTPTAEDSSADEATRVVHRVKAGETLYSIARKYQTTIDVLKSVNNLRTSVLKVGARLVVLARGSASGQQ
jgi:membrane-bound lytic murein transglycosylase D